MKLFFSGIFFFSSEISEKLNFLREIRQYVNLGFYPQNFQTL